MGRTLTFTAALLLAVSMVTGAAGSAQQRGRGGRLSVGVAEVPLPAGPVVFDTAEEHKIRVSIVARELSHPWGMAWLPNGDILVTERAGRLRLIRGGALEPNPISGLPPMHVRGLAGLLDVALHPNFAANKLVYFSYVKDGEKGATTAVARGRLDGIALTGVQDVIVTESWM